MHAWCFTVNVTHTVNSTTEHVSFLFENVVPVHVSFAQHSCTLWGFASYCTIISTGSRIYRKRYNALAVVYLWVLLPSSVSRDRQAHRLNMELDLQSLFGHSLAENPQLPPPHTPHLGLYTRALLVGKDRRHLFVTPCRGKLLSRHWGRKDG
jgi:hypothetical protein